MEEVVGSIPTRSTKFLNSLDRASAATGVSVSEMAMLRPLWSRCGEAKRIICSISQGKAGPEEGPMEQIISGLLQDF